MSRLEARLREAVAARERALIPYVVAGDPSPDESLALLAALASGGAAALEIGIPWSDPIADGPANQAAMARALGSGMTAVRALELVRELRRRRDDVPIVLMTYANPVFRMGFGRFVEEAAASGVDGLLVTDLPLEEDTELSLCAGDAGLDVVRLHAPTTPASRDAALLAACSGFLYVVARMGVTGTGMGARSSELAARTARLRDPSVNPRALPLAIGFGISSPEDLESALSMADAAVVGSLFSHTIAEAASECRSCADAVAERARWLLSAR